MTDHISGPWADPAAHRAFVRARTLHAYPPGQGYWTLRPRGAPDRFLGWVLLIPDDAEGPEVEIGWRLLPEHWGQGYAGEAASVLLGYGLDRLALPLVISDIRAGNPASLRVARRIGMTETRRYRDGEGHELVRFEAGPEACQGP